MKLTTFLPLLGLAAAIDSADSNQNLVTNTKATVTNRSNQNTDYQDVKATAADLTQKYYDEILQRISSTGLTKDIAKTLANGNPLKAARQKCTKLIHKGQDSEFYECYASAVSDATSRVPSKAVESEYTVLAKQYYGKLQKGLAKAFSYESSLQISDRGTGKTKELWEASKVDTKKTNSRRYNE